MTATGANKAIDRLIGRNIRFHRLRKELSQAKLAAMVGVTFQQLQKYERGANRISASRLFSLARILGVPIAAFFKARGDAGGHAPARTLAAERDEARLMRAYARIGCTRRRRLLTELVQEIARTHQGTSTTCKHSQPLR